MIKTRACTGIIFALAAASAGCSAPVDSSALDQAGEDGTLGASQHELVGSCGVNIDPLRSIMIVRPNIVDDARSSNLTNGPWSFRRMIENMAPSASAADTDAFLRNIFESWLSDNIVQGELLMARPDVQSKIMAQFQLPGTPRQFDLALAPFQLIAIANRLDLRSATSGGEGRMIYGLKDASGAFLQAFTLIIEYALPLRPGVATPAQWSAKWHELDGIDPVAQQAAYLAKLQEITDLFTVRNAFVGRPNGSAVNQIRTNEVALSSPTPWQLREFNMNSAGMMVPASLKESPNRALINRSQSMRDFINQNPVLASTTGTAFMSLKMPSTFNGGFFEGSQALMFNASILTNPARWDLSPTEDQLSSVAVDNFGFLTCNGCHNENKNLSDRRFTHVSSIDATPNRVTGENDGTGRLSDFMLIGDPDKGSRRPAELTRRATDMANLFCTEAVGFDLLLSNVTWSPANPSPGQAVTFSATVTNHGTATKPAGTINGVAFNVDGTLRAWSDTNTSALAPGQSVMVTANSGPTGSATWSASSGLHSIQAWVDDVNRVNEVNESNNKLVVPLAVGIDLTISNISWSPTRPTVGQALTFSATVKNEGTLATPAGTVIGVAFQINGTTVSWSDTSSTSLAPGGARTLTANFGPAGSATWLATSGNKKLAAWVDDVSRMNDVNRSNNKLETSLPIP